MTPLSPSNNFWIRHRVKETRRKHAIRTDPDESDGVRFGHSDVQLFFRHLRDSDAPKKLNTFFVTAADVTAPAQITTRLE